MSKLNSIPTMCGGRKAVHYAVRKTLQANKDKQLEAGNAPEPLNVPHAPGVRRLVAARISDPGRPEGPHECGMCMRTAC